MSANPTSATPSDDLANVNRRRSTSLSRGVAIGIAVVLLGVGLGGGYFLGQQYGAKTNNGGNGSGTTGTGGGTIQLTETGSSLLYPLFEHYWDPNYTAAVVSAASTGSGAGQSNAEQGLVNIGASDAYLSNASTTNLINLPAAISAQLVYYNLPGVSQHLNLNGTVLAMIYEGSITKWNDPMILAAQSASVQSELTAIGAQTIVPIKRSDSSGDTFLFTSLCDESWSGWTYSFGTSALSGTPWTGENGNSGVLSELQKTQYSIGYVGISYEAQATGVQYAAVGDNASLTATGGTDAANYILPSATNISYDANLGLTRLQYSQYQLAVSLILGGSRFGAITLQAGGGTNPTSQDPTPYPIVNLEYALIKTTPGGSTVTAANLAATVQFFYWALSSGNYGTSGQASTWINAVGFIPLTPAVIGYDMQELASVQP